MDASYSEFAARLIESGLFAQPAFDEFLKSLEESEKPRNGEELARLLVIRRQLTPYQAKCIIAGETGSLVLGNYVVLDQIGRGGMGVVLKANHRRMDRVVALKVLSAESVKTPSLVERFHREVKAAARLEHPNIVTAYDADESRGTHFLVMQFVDGRDLAAVVKRNGPLDTSQAVDCILQAARGLEYAHFNGVIHRDIKPGNLLLTKEGVVKILDMGLARFDNPLGEQQQDHSLTGTGTIMGTVDYMSPEQALNTKLADARSDQYSLGITLHFLLTGKPAYQGDTAMEKLLAHRDSQPPSLVAILDGERKSHRGLLDRLDVVFRRMIAKKPEDRYASMTEVITALTALGKHNFDEPTVSYSPVSLPASSTFSTQRDAALAAFLQSPGTALQTTDRSVTHEATPASATDVPTVLTSGSVEDTATTLRQSPLARSRKELPKRVGAVAFGLFAIGLITWLAVWLLNRPDQKTPTADSKSNQIPESQSTISAAAPTGWRGWPADAPPPAIAPFDAQQARKHQEAWADFLGVPVEYENSIGMKFVLIPPGEFLMGSTPEEIQATLAEGDGSEPWGVQVRSAGPQHSVILTQPFYLGLHEVTQGHYEQIMQSNPSIFSPTGGGKESVVNIDTRTLPVEFVKWNDAAEFCNRLSALEKFGPAYSGNGELIDDEESGYRLPTEAQWEFACRAGTTTTYWTGDTEESLETGGWIGANSQGRPHTGGELSANHFGLFDMHGNVWEWGNDWWGPSDYEQFGENPARDPRGPGEGSQRVIRGGDWACRALPCSSSARSAADPGFGGLNFGFRASLSVDAVKQALKRAKPVAWQHWPAEAPPPAIAPFDADQAKKHQESWAKYLEVPVEWENSVGMTFRLIPPGEYLRGGTEDEIAAAVEYYEQNLPTDNRWQTFVRSEGPQHRVVVNYPFFISVFETTQEQFQRVMDRNPSAFSASGMSKDRVDGLATANFPVESISWNDAADFCIRLSELESIIPGCLRTDNGVDLHGDGYRLPTEAEWESACRAGTQTKYWYGDNVNGLSGVAWREHSSKRTHEVGELSANPFGMFDILGNVAEFCHDQWEATAYERFRDQVAVNPMLGDPSVTDRVLRGGHWLERYPGALRCASRSSYDRNTPSWLHGFRPIISANAVKSQLARPKKQAWHGWPADSPPPAIAPFDAEQAKQHQDAWAKHLDLPVELENSIGMKFRLIPPAEFLMGSAEEEIAAVLSSAGGDEGLKGILQSETPRHNVILTQPFYLGKHEVTQSQYERVMGTNPAHFSASGPGSESLAGIDAHHLPVESVSWNDAAEFCAKLSELEGHSPRYVRNEETVMLLEGDGFRLPTEAQWEFACRAGSMTSYWLGNQDDDLLQIGWFNNNASVRTHIVGELKENPFGLFDTHGNVWEWCEDYYGEYPAAAVADPAGLDSGDEHVIRGGSWAFTSVASRSAGRFRQVAAMRNLNFGFRVMLPVNAARRRATRQ